LVTKLLADVAAIGTFLGVVFAGWQLLLSRQQARSEFEDRLTGRYLAVAADLPVEMFFGEQVDPEIVRLHRAAFYRYFDLCNEQAFLHEQGRISDATWVQWRDGMKGNFARPAFHAAWFDEIAPHVGDDFEELKRVLDTFPKYRNPPAAG
jgi:hypothetical protein